MSVKKPATSSPKRYAFICMTYPPQIGGVSKHIAKVHSALKETGINGDVIVIGNRPKIENSDAIWISKKRLFGLPYIGWLYVSIKLFLILKQNKYTIWHFHDYKVFQIFMIIPLLLLKHNKMFITFHGWEGKCPPDPKVIKIRQRIAQRMTDCMGVGAFINKWYGTTCKKIIYGGIDPNTTANEVPVNNDLNRIVYIGRLAYDTGILPLIEALAVLKKDFGKQMILTIYGGGPLKESITAVAEQNDLTIIIKEPVDDISIAFEKSTFVFASGYLTTLEAWAARRIVFAYYDNPLREDYLRMHPASPSLHIASTANEMAEVLLNCIKNPSQAIAKSGPGWAWAHTQTWQRVAQEYIDLWQI